MEIPQLSFANESPVRPGRSVDELAMVASRIAAPAACKPFEAAELVVAFDFTRSLAFPIETFIS